MPPDRRLSKNGVEDIAELALPLFPRSPKHVRRVDRSSILAFLVPPAVPVPFYAGSIQGCPHETDKLAVLLHGK